MAPRLFIVAGTIAQLYALLASLAALTREPPVPAGYFALDDVRVSDGDTINGTIELPWDISLRQQSIRALGYDAWEVSAYRASVGRVSEAERAKGRVAKAALEKLLDGGRPLVKPGQPGRDNYGRVLAELWVLDADGRLVEVAQAMFAGGHDRTGQAP